MKIKVKLYTILKKYGEGKIDKDSNLTIQQGLTLKDLISHLGIPEKTVSISLANGLVKKIDYKLQEGDEVKFFSYIGGG
ncbi:MoaD/ThiS family protein [Candidatus Woesebacteria bacterium]|jgi:sulfur carrier protein ThiS|nr:MAG: MoaD/ThiS family protein [Candidatus Woesebacteria bacterium]